MAINKDAYQEISAELRAKNITLVAVSKTKPVEDIQALYDLGHRDFGENYIQELTEKSKLLPGDICWHFIGHLQSNKVKYIASFIHLIHGVDSFRLLQEIGKQAVKNQRVIDCLLQVHIAREETKFGMDEQELDDAIRQFEKSAIPGVRISGLMGMASFIDEEDKVRNEFRDLKRLFDKYALQPTANCQLQTISMGMSGDYKIAIEEGSNLVRIGSLLFGART